jgi:hypothetical protein
MHEFLNWMLGGLAAFCIEAKRLAIYKSRRKREVTGLQYAYSIGIVLIGCVLGGTYPRCSTLLPDPFEAILAGGSADVWLSIAASWALQFFSTRSTLSRREQLRDAMVEYGEPEKELLSTGEIMAAAPARATPSWRSYMEAAL